MGQCGGSVLVQISLVPVFLVTVIDFHASSQGFIRLSSRLLTFRPSAEIDLFFVDEVHSGLLPYGFTDSLLHHLVIAAVLPPNKDASGATGLD